MQRNYSLGNEELIHSQANSLTASPVDKPQLTRSLTFNPALLFSTFSPVPVARAATGFAERPGHIIIVYSKYASVIFET